MAGTDSRNEMIADGPAVVLVEPQLGENIGAAARAMANFGLADLRLVAPRDGWPSESARASASKADHVIDGARVFDTLAEAIADLSFVYATTARRRGMLKPVRGPREACATLRGLHGKGTATGILFGRERWGLSSEEVALADEIVTFPVNPAFASLNIAQAVLLMGYEWFAGEEERLPIAMPDAQAATKQELFGLFDHAERALDGANYFRPPDKRGTMVEHLRTILSKGNFTSPEVHALRGMFAALEGRKPRAPKG